MMSSAVLTSLRRALRLRAEKSAAPCSDAESQDAVCGTAEEVIKDVRGQSKLLELPQEMQ